MAKKLSVDQRSIYDLFRDKSSFFLVPDYQRPYAWSEVECETLWNDIYSFAIPDNNYENFDDDNDEYFLGAIVVFKNPDNKLEIIDGQQRITTLMLLLRAFYNSYSSNMQDSKAQNVRQSLEHCLWKTNAFSEPDMNSPKIDSEVAIDNDKHELIQILLTGKADGLKSRYAENYRFFLNKIDEFKGSAPDYFSYLPIRILNNCILLPIEAESQDTALRIFSTLNDRGKPLSDSDIFKAQLYKAFANEKENRTDYFIKEWKKLEEICSSIFTWDIDNPMDELFSRYMYYERAKRGNKDTTVEGLRKFYEADKYKLLRVEHERTLKNLILLAEFWKDIVKQNKDKFSDRVLRRLFVLHYAPNSMWAYITSVYFLHNNKDGLLNEEKFYNFLNVITAFIWAFTIIRPGVSQLRGSVFSEMVNIVNDVDVTFSGSKFDADELTRILNNYDFNQHKPITRSMLVWHAFNNDNQTLLERTTRLEIEHIYAKNRTPHPANLEAIGNKSILEKTINIRASDYRFKDKAKYYLGLVEGKTGTKIYELVNLAQTRDDFTEQDIDARTQEIINSFIEFLRENNLLR